MDIKSHYKNIDIRSHKHKFNAAAAKEWDREESEDVADGCKGLHLYMEGYLKHLSELEDLESQLEAAEAKGVHGYDHKVHVETIIRQCHVKISTCLDEVKLKRDLLCEKMEEQDEKVKGSKTGRAAIEMIATANHFLKEHGKI